MDFRLIAGFDDGYFPPSYKGGKGYTILAGVVARNRTHFIERIGISAVLVDGRSVTDRIISMSKLLQPDVVLLDGVTYAGFDVANPSEIFSRTGIPVIVVQQYPLNLKSIWSALSKHFSDYIERYKTIESVVRGFVYLDTPWKTIQYCSVGLSSSIAARILLENMFYSPVPEPLRIAHLLASTLSRTIEIIQEEV